MDGEIVGTPVSKQDGCVIFHWLQDAYPRIEKLILEELDRQALEEAEKELERKVTLTHVGREVTLTVRTDRYEHGGGLAVQLEEDGEPYATLSVNVDGLTLKDDEFVAKTYSENEGLLEGLLAAGVVELTGRSADIGPICRLLPQ